MTKIVAMTFSIGLAALVCSPVCAADFRPMDVKTGEWESTVTVQSGGMPSIPDEVLARLTPEQRAKMEAAWQNRNGAAKPTVSKSCLTKDQLDKPFNLGDDKTKTCTHTMLASTGSKQEIKIECSRDGAKSSGVIKVEAVNSENVKGSMQMTVSSGEHTMNMNYAFASKWIGPACSEK